MLKAKLLSATAGGVSAGTIGFAGDQGFGVGVYPDTLPSGFTGMSGFDDPTSANYGNYTYTDGSVMVFIPKFYYRIASTSSPYYATYGLNAIDIAGIDTYATTAAANAAGFALHRAFIDGGSEKHGFFIDKYLCSKNAGNNAGLSASLGVPISLTTSTSYTRSNGMTGCTGILADAVVLSRARGSGVFNVASLFMYSALALLSLAHGQAATGTTNCAWYDASRVTNFPKGCNNDALGDVNDATLTFQTAGDSGSANKPKTGSANNLAKTAHNGQTCGVLDLNGAMWEVALGVTSPGSSGTSTTQITNGDTYVLKESVALSSLTAGWNGTNDAWGDATNLATKYDSQTGFLVWGSSTTTSYYGNSTNQVFSEAMSGAGWLRTAAMVPATTSSYTTTAGTSNDLWGRDALFPYNRHNTFPVCGGFWDNAADAGVFARNWNASRSSVNNVLGFRAAAFGS
jgi:hypothetical protein